MSEQPEPPRFSTISVWGETIRALDGLCDEERRTRASEIDWLVERRIKELQRLEQEERAAPS